MILSWTATQATLSRQLSGQLQASEQLSAQLVCTIVIKIFSAKKCVRYSQSVTYIIPSFLILRLIKIAVSLQIR